MSDEKKTIYKQIAEALGCDYNHVKNVISGNGGVNRRTALNKKIITLYLEKKEKELELLRNSIIDRATNDYILQ